MYDVCHNNVYPYMGVSFDETVTFEPPGRTFRIIVFGAYNAFGLIGPEHNGIAIFDVDNVCVVLDRHAEQTTGFFGPSAEQLKIARLITTMNWETFLVFCLMHPRCRGVVGIDQSDADDIRRRGKATTMRARAQAQGVPL